MKKVLIVDDEPMVLSSTQRLLADLGFSTATEMDPRAVVSAVRRERPDVVLQDLRMPGLDIEALLADLRADPDVGRTPVILFSAGMELDEVRTRVPVDGVLEKPFRPAEAVDAIERVTP